MNIRNWLNRKAALGRTRGRLENLAFSDVVQMMTLGGKTGCILVKTGDRRGEAWFEKGRLRHAGGQGTAGEDAFCRMVGWERGEFEILHGEVTCTPSMDCDPMHLLMEGARRMDEEKRDRKRIRPNRPARLKKLMAAWVRDEA